MYSSIVHYKHTQLPWKWWAEWNNVPLDQVNAKRLAWYVLHFPQGTHKKTLSSLTPEPLCWSPFHQWWEVLCLIVDAHEQKPAFFWLSFLFLLDPYVAQVSSHPLKSRRWIRAVPMCILLYDKQIQPICLHYALLRFVSAFLWSIRWWAPYSSV